MRHDIPNLKGTENRSIIVPVLLDEATANNSATVDVALSPGYRRYNIELSKVSPVSDGADFNARVSFDNGATFSSGTIYGYTSMIPYANAVAVISGSATTLIRLTGGILVSGSGGTFAATCVVGNPGGNSKGFLIHGNGTYITNDPLGGAEVTHFSGCVTGSQSIVTHLRFFMSTGNISTGTFKVFGMTPNAT